MTLPALTEGQRRAALGKAQEMRSRRRRLREQLKKGTMTLKEALDRSDDEVVAKMRVAYLLASLPRVGKTTARKIMEEIGIDSSRRVQGLGKRQKEALLERFGGKR
ncbi:MAG TPA: integration host factor [Clostridiales bacterium]|nr:integration host factor [Clostridiales bacterium]